MISAEVRRPFQRADKRGQVPREPGRLIPVPASILNQPVIGHSRIIPPRSQPVPVVTVGVAMQQTTTPDRAGASPPLRAMPQP